MPPQVQDDIDAFMQKRTATAPKLPSAPKPAPVADDDVDGFMSRRTGSVSAPTTKKEQLRRSVTGLQNELTAATPQLKPGNTLNVTTGQQYPTPPPAPFQPPIDLRLNAPNEAQKAFDRAAAATQPAPQPKPRNAFQAPRPKPMLERVMAQQAIERQQPQTVETDPQRLEQLKQTTGRQIAEQRDVRNRMARSAYGELSPVARMGARALAKIGGATDADMAATMPTSRLESIPGQVTQGAITTAARIPEGLEQLGEAIPNPFTAITGQRDRMLREKAAARARGENTGLLTSGITKAGDALADVVAPVDKTDQSFLTAKLPRGLGSSVPFIASSALGGGMPAAAAVGAAINAQQTGEDMDRLGVQDEATRRKATAVAGLIGSLEAFGIEGKLGKVFGGRGGLTKRLLGAGGEGLQEWTTEELNDINAKLIAAYDPNRSINPLQRKQLEAAALGALTGGLFEAGGKLAQMQGDAQAVNQTRAERPVAPTDIRPTTMGPTQITPLSQAPAAPAPTVAPATSQSLPAVTAPTTPLPQAQPQGFPRLPEPQGVNVRQAKILGMPLPAEVTLNEQVQAAAQLLDSTNEGDQRQGRRMLNKALTDLRKVEGYLAEAALPPDAPRPFTAVRDAIEGRLKPAPKVKETPANQAPSSSAVETAQPTASNALRAEADAAKIKAAEFEQVGDFTQAAATYQAAHQNLKRLRRSMGQPKTPEAVAQINQIDREISIADANRRKANQAARTAQRQANAPTAEIPKQVAKNAKNEASFGITPQPATFSRPESAQTQAQQQDARNISGNISAPLLRPDAVQNPEPVAPVEERTGDTIDFTPKAPARKRGGMDTENLTIGGMLKRRFPEGVRLADKGEARNLGGREGNALVGLVNKNSRVGVDDVAYALHEEGLRLPDGRPFVENSRVVATEAEVLDFLRSNSKQKVGGTKSLERRLTEEEAAYNERQPFDQIVADVDAEPTNRLREAEYEGGEVQRYSKPLEGQTVEREVFQPDTADLREVREFGKREPRTEQFTEEPPTAPLARRRQPIRPPAPASPRPVGNRPLSVDVAGTRTPTAMSPDFPRARREMVKQGREVEARLTEGQDKGEFGNVAEAMFKSNTPDVLHGQDSFFHDPDLKGKLGLTRDAEMADVRRELKTQLARSLGLSADEVSLSHIKPEVWRAWAKQKGLGREAVRKLEAGIARAERKQRAIETNAQIVAEESQRAQSEVRQPAAEAGNSLEESRRLATEYHDRFSKAQTASEMQAVIESGRELTRQLAESQSQAKTPSEKRDWDRLIANVRDFDERYIETYNEVRAEESRQAGKERQEAEAKASREQIAKDFPDTVEPGVSHYIYARNKKGQKVQVGGPYESAAAAYADRNRVKDELPPRIARDFVGFSYGKRADAPAPPAKSIDQQIKDIRDLQAFDLIDDKEAKRKIAALEAQRPKIAERRSEAMPERYTGRQLFENAQLTFRPARNRPATLVANDWGGAMLNRLLSEKFDVTTTDANFTIGAKDAKDLRDYLADAKDSGIYEPAQVANMDAMLRQMDAAIADAEANQQDVAFVTRRPAEPISATKAKIRHEAAHLSQSRIAADLSALTGKNWLDSQPNAKDIHKELDRRGYAPETHDYEAAAFVASGDYGAFGMNLDQAAKFLSDYFGAVVEKHGKRALQKFGAIDPKLQPTLEAARRETETRQTENQRRSVEAAQRSERRIGAAGEARGSRDSVLARRREGDTGDAREASRSPRTRASVENSPEFKRWFRDSKVVDESGKPLVVYHGTGKYGDFDTFSTEKTGGVGFYFTRNPEDAGRYATDGANIRPVYLSISNPATPEALRRAEQQARGGNPRKQIIEQLQSEGFDGIIRTGEIIAFSPNQIKSAIGNRGTFDPSSPRISEQKSRPARRGQVLASGLGAFQNLFERDAKPKEAKPARPVPLPRNFNLADWSQKLYRDAMAAGLPKDARAKYDAAKTVREKNVILMESKLDSARESQIFGLIDRAQAAAEKNDGSALYDVLSDATDLMRKTPSERGLKRVGQEVGNALSLPRALQASMDASALLRQGAILTLPPSQWGKAAKATVRMFQAFNTAKYKEIGKEINLHEDAETARESGLYLSTDKSGLLTKKEEDFVSSWADKIPLVKQSEQAYKTYLDSLRMDSFARYKKSIDKAKGLTEEQKQNAYKAAAEWVNVATGRGSLGQTFENLMPTLSKIFFAPRYAASRIQVLNPYTYAKNANTPEGRVVLRNQMSDMVQYAGMVSLTLALASAAGASVELDPEDPDFLKIKVGQTRYDGLAGLQQPMRLFYRVGDALRRRVTGEKAASRQTALDITARYGRSKLAPVPSFFLDYVTGKDFVGRDFEMKRAVLDRVTPLMWKDMADAYEKEGGAGAVKMLPAMFGIGVQNYAEKTGALKGSRFTKEAEGRGLKYDFIRQKVGEPEAIYKQRVQRVEGWMSEYGDKLLSHPRYGTLTAAQQEAAIESLRRRIGTQQNATRPRLDSFAPEKVIQSVLKSEATRPKREAGKLWSPPANRP